MQHKTKYIIRPFSNYFFCSCGWVGIPHSLSEEGVNAIKEKRRHVNEKNGLTKPTLNEMVSYPLRD